MKKLLSFWLVLLCFGGLLSLTAQEEGTVTDLPVAIINLHKTEVISKKQLAQNIDKLGAQLGISMSIEQKEEVLDTMIDQALILQAASQSQVSVSDAEVEQAGMTLVSQQLQQVGAIPPGAVLTDAEQYKLVVAQQGVDFKEYQKNVKNQLIVEKYVSQVKRDELEKIPEATSKEIQDEYQRRIQEFARSETVWFSHVFFDTKDLSSQDAQAKRGEAEEVFKTIRNTSATFEEMVRKKSEDKVSQAKNGYVGALERGNSSMTSLFGQDFIEEIFTMTPGELYGVVESHVGYHIVKISEKRDAYLMSLSDFIVEDGASQNITVKDYLERLIYAGRQQEVFQKALEDMVAEVRQKASVRYFKEHLE